jgi:hypothetical protein
MSSPISNAATASRARRTVYALADKRGWYLLQPGRDFHEFTPDAGCAVRQSMAWLTIEVAQQKQKDLLRSHKLELSISRIELVLGHGGWEPVSTEGVAA